MTIAHRQAEQLRRRAIVALLYFAPGQALTVAKLRGELENVHGQIASMDRVRADLVWLADVGVVQTVGDAAKLTERGGDIACDRAAMPGES